MTSRFPQKPPALPYFWVGLMIAAASLTAVAVWRRARISRVSRGRRVKDVMVRDVVAVPPSIMLLEAARVMRDANVGVLPVVEDGILRGVVTDRDLVVRAMAQGANPESTLVGECATQDVVSARPDTDIEQAMKLMARCQIGRLPVVDENDRLLGIVTLSSVALRSREDHETLDTAKEVSRRSARAA